MSTYEYIPVNDQFERSNISMLSSSPMFEGRVNPMFPSKLMFTPFVFILMIDIGSSPEWIQNSVKNILVRFYWGTQAYALILKESQGEEGWSTGKLVIVQIKPHQIRQLVQFSRNGTLGIQNPVKTYKNQVTPSYWYDFTEEREPMP